jgi:hypothetical protein
VRRGLVPRGVARPYVTCYRRCHSRNGYRS